MSDGFTEMLADAQRFFTDLEQNNTRDWFEPKKSLYKETIQRPAELLTDLFADELSRLTGEAHTGKVNRIYRDVRFSKDKSPYNTHLSVLWQAGDAREHGWLFSVSAGATALMTGLHALQGPSLAAYRAYADRDGETLQSAIDHANSVGATLSGWGAYKLKRVPKPYDPDHPYADLLKLKQVVLSAPIRSSALKDGLISEMMVAAKAYLPFWRACRSAVSA